MIYAQFSWLCDLFINAGGCKEVVLWPAASHEDVRFSENILGFELPATLRYFYEHLGNGGGVLGASIYGVRGGDNYDGSYIHDFYRFVRDIGFHAQPTLYLFRGEVVHGWPERLLPVGLWGGVAGEFSLCLDCNWEDMPVYFFEAAAVNGANPAFPIPISFLYDSFASFITTLRTTENPEIYAMERLKEDLEFVVANLCPWMTEESETRLLSIEAEPDCDDSAGRFDEPFIDLFDEDLPVSTYSQSHQSGSGWLSGQAWYLPSIQQAERTP